MAKVLNIPTRGSIGNVTHSAGRTGQIQRSRGIPSQPRTAAQVAQRSRLTTLSSAWRGLTAGQRASWNSFANSFTVTNSLGVSGNMTGHQAYVKVNSVNLLNGDSAVANPPGLPAFVAVTATGLTGAAGTPALAVAGSSPAGGTKLMIYASGQLSAGVSFHNDFRYLATFTTATSSAFNILSAYNAKFGTLVAGKQIMVRVVQSQSGMQDNGTVFTAIVAA